LEAVRLNYGNWVRKRILFVLGIATLAVGALEVVPAGAVYHAIVTIAFVLLLVTFLFPLYAYFMFSERGGGFQAKLYGCIVQKLGQNLAGKYLDIGCGNGVLTISLAMHNPQAEVVGIDFWGPQWEYSKSNCEQNARLAKVADRVRFVRGDAGTLEFAAAPRQLHIRRLLPGAEVLRSSVGVPRLPREARSRRSAVRAAARSPDGAAAAAASADLRQGRGPFRQEIARSRQRVQIIHVRLDRAVQSRQFRILRLDQEVLVRRVRTQAMTESEVPGRELQRIAREHVARP
jgi:SAM-dependent methyltransferase